jgi:hypothetical protein
LADWLLVAWIGWVALFAFYSLRQGGIRYLLPLMPAVAIASATSVIAIIRQFRSQNLSIFIIGSLVLYLVVSGLWNQPYQLDYYNEFVGGSGGVYRNQSFQLGWWGEGVAEAVTWLNDHGPSGASVTFRAIPNRTEGLLRADFEHTDNGEFLITNWNDRYWNGEFNPSQLGYDKVYSVKTRGAILAEVWQRK